MEELLPRLKAALSHRYDVEKPLGAGGTALVYLARDRKHDRLVALKVLRPSVAEAVGSERFLREIRIAANLSHPNILPLHESGEADGLLYFVMPFVEGESLRDRLEREKQLPIHDALEIVHDVAAGLAFAHAHGVVHRDIKPANIMLVGDRAMVADFGVAVAVRDDEVTRLTSDGMSIGSPAYMSPEQFGESSDVDARSDQYSLACVTYEMLTGAPPFNDPSLQALMARHLTASPPAIRPVRETVSAAVEAAVLQALAKSRADRFKTIEDFVAALDLDAVRARPSPSLLKGRRSAGALRVALGGVGLFALALAITLLMARSGESIPFEERDFILITDLANETGDEVFDQSLARALTVAIDQSTYVNVFPRNRVQEMLRRLDREATAHVDEELALHIALRAQLKAVLSVGISNIDDTYLLTTRLLDPATGTSVESRSAQAQGKSSVLPALDSLAKAVRSDLGESLQGIQERGVRLDDATTGSLEALKLWTQGNVAWGSARYEEGRTLFRQAVALDPGFAWAHASLGLAVNWLDGQGSGQAHFDSALSLLDRVTERERLLISGLAADGEEAVRNYEAYLGQYPDDRDAWYNLGNSLRSAGRKEESVPAYRRSVELDPDYVWGNINLGVTLDELGNRTEAAEAFDRAFESEPEQAKSWRGDVNRISGFAWAKMGDTLRAREHFELLLDGEDFARASGLRSLGLLEMSRGRYDAGLQYLGQAILINQTTGAPLSEYRNRMYRAVAYATKGMSAELNTELDSAGVIYHELGLGPFWGVTWGLNLARAGRLPEAQAIVDEWREAGIDQGDTRWLGELLQGEVALAHGDAGEAMGPLEAAVSLHSDNVTRSGLARAYHEAGRLDEAEATYRQVVDHMDLGWEAQEPWVSSHYHLGRVLEDQGRAMEAVEMYERLLEIWAEADSGIPLLEDARRRKAALET